MNSESGGNEFSSVLQNHSPVFDPATGHIWFLAGKPSGMTVGTINEIPADGGTPSTNGQALKFAGDDEFLISGRSRHVIVSRTGIGFALSNPSGTVTAAYGGFQGADGTPSLSLVNPADPNGGHLGDDETRLVNFSRDLPGAGLTPLVWAGDDTLITSVDLSTMSYPRANGLELFQFDSNHIALLGTHRLIPDSDRTNYSPVVSPDGTTVQFISIRGTSRSVYSVKIGAATAAPVLVPSPEGPGVLLEWRSGAGGTPATGAPSARPGTLDAAKIAVGVKKTLTDDPPMGYGIAGVSGVNCPADQPVVVGVFFTCTATINGASKLIRITVKNSAGQYEVGLPN